MVMTTLWGTRNEREVAQCRTRDDSRKLNGGNIVSLPNATWNSRDVVDFAYGASLLEGKMHTHFHNSKSKLYCPTRLSNVSKQGSVRGACAKNKMRDLEGVLPHNLRKLN